MTVASDTDTGEFLPMPPRAPASPPEPISSRIEVDVAAATDTGRARANNEDSYLVARVERALHTVATNLPDGCVPERFAEVSYAMVVADGVGGGAAGEVASRTALSTLVNLVLHTPDWIMRDGGAEAERLQNRMIERYRQIGASIDDLSAGDPALTGMATTMTLAVSNGPDLFLTHVGDSRAYLYREGELFRLTHDHTYAQELADHGLIQQHEVASHRLRHVLTRTLGPRGSEVQVDVRQLLLRDGDRLLLCTDGLTEMLPNEEIGNLLASESTASAICSSLIDAALAGGGKDNVTVVVACYRFPTSPERDAVRPGL